MNETELRVGRQALYDGRIVLIVQPVHIHGERLWLTKDEDGDSRYRVLRDQDLHG